MKLRELRQKRAEVIAQARAILDKADGENRAITAEEQSAYDALAAQAENMQADIARREALETEERELAATIGEPIRPDPGQRLDSETRAFLSYLRTGQRNMELRASNDTDMNITTAADGGVAVPTGLFHGIIAKRNEAMLARVLGVRNIPGRGTTVDVPYDNGDANVFVSTNEVGSFDRDAPVLGKVSMTLVKYTKKIQLSYELLEDEDARVMEFLSDYVGRAMANTHNNLLITAALASGTSNTLAAAAAATATDVTELVYALKGEYADGAQWVMKRATEGAFRALTGNVYQCAPTPAGPMGSLWGFPVRNSEYVEAIATTKKSLIFGNFNFMGMREAPELTMLRDPYSSAATGQVNLFYYFRVVYKVLIAEAIQYGVHP